MEPKALQKDLENNSLLESHENKLNMNLEALQKYLEEQYPFGVPRNKLREATGGVLHGRTMANLDSLGVGIPDRFSIGNRTVYPVKSLIGHIVAKISHIGGR